MSAVAEDVIGVMRANGICADIRNRVAELLAADNAYDEARLAYDEAKRAMGGYNVNPLPRTHPASKALAAASIRRAAAMAACGVVA